MSLRKLDLKFGVAPKYRGSIADDGNTLSAAELRRLKSQLALFDRKFPQVTLAVLLAGSPAGRAMSEYVFWLARRRTKSTILTYSSRARRRQTSAGSSKSFKISRA